MSSEVEEEEDDSSYQGSPPSSPWLSSPPPERSRTTRLEVHNRGNVWYGMRHWGGKLGWRDPNGTKGFLPLGYCATRYVDGDDEWIRLTIDVSTVTGEPEFVFDLHDGVQMRETVREAGRVYRFLRDSGLLDQASKTHSWMTCFELPLGDISQAPFCAHQRQMEDACLAVGEEPRELLAKHGKLLWLSPPETAPRVASGGSTRKRMKA